MVEQLGIAKELQPAALELGKINGTLYGIVPDLRLRTLVTGSPELRDWNYETFLQCIPYTGFPKALNAVYAAKKVFAERGLIQ